MISDICSGREIVFLSGSLCLALLFSGRVICAQELVGVSEGISYEGLVIKEQEAGVEGLGLESLDAIQMGEGSQVELALEEPQADPLGEEAQPDLSGQQDGNEAFQSVVEEPILEIPQEPSEGFEGIEGSEGLLQEEQLGLEDPVVIMDEGLLDDEIIIVEELEDTVSEAAQEEPLQESLPVEVLDNPVQWVLEDGTLSLSGAGRMDDYCLSYIQETGDYTTDAPWELVKEDISGIVMAEGVDSIGSYAFYECENLAGVSIPAGVQSIGGGAFESCVSLTGVSFPESVTELGTDILAGCKNLKSVSIAGNVSKIPWEAFMGCVNLESVQIPESVWSIESNAFRGCVSLESVDIPDGVAYIGRSAFNRAGLRQVELPESLLSIGACAFEYCTKLKSLRIPAGVTNIGDGAFAGCGSLTLYVTPGSVAEEYAISNGIAYVLEP